MRTPHETATHMRKTHGKDASIHACYNLMLYDKGSRGHAYWVDVLQCIRESMIDEIKHLHDKGE